VILHGDSFKVKIDKDTNFRNDSSIKPHYDVVFNLYGLDCNTSYETLSITIDFYSTEKRFAVLGSMIVTDYQIAILDGCNLILLIDDVIIVVDIKTLNLITQKELPDGYYFSIHTYNDGYIVYGELDIIKLSNAPAFEIEWTFSGNDIFVTQDDSSSFQISNELIYLKDWNEREYVVDKNGKEL